MLVKKEQLVKNKNKKTPKDNVKEVEDFLHVRYKQHQSTY